MADNNTPTWMDKIGGVKATYALGTALVGTGTLVSGITVESDVCVIVGGVLTAVGTGLLMFFRAWTETTYAKANADTTTTTKTVSAASNDKVTVQAALAPAAETKPVE